MDQRSHGRVVLYGALVRIGLYFPSLHLSTVSLVCAVMKPPLSVLGIAMVVVSAGILLVIVLILIVVVWKKYSNLKRRKREYNFTDSESE